MRLAAIYGGSAHHHRALTTPKYARWVDDLVYLPELGRADLAGFEGLLVPERLHTGLLDAARPRLLELLERGGTVVLFATQRVLVEQPVGWLPGIRFEHRPTNFWWWLEEEAEPPVTAADPDHPLFTHLSLADATWHHHGVLRPPRGARTLVAARTGGAVLYVDAVSTPGTLLVTTLDPLYHFGAYFMPATERFLDGFLPWLATSETGRGSTR